MQRALKVLLAVALAATSLTVAGVATAAHRPDDVEIDTAGLDVRIDGVQAFANLGGDDSGYSAAVNHAGDVNGDGIDDLIIGEGGEPAGSTGAWVLFGPITGTPDLNDLGTTGFRIEAADPESFGRTAAAAGDVNGDGFDDVIVGGRSSSSVGRFVVVYGSASPTDVDATALGDRGFTIQQPTDTFVSSYWGIGDINGDGLDDVAIGSPSAAEFAGTVHVVLGAEERTGTVDTSALGDDGFVVTGNPGDGLGVRIAAGDVNDDGQSDMVALSDVAAMVLFGSESEDDVTVGALGDRGYVIEYTPDAGVDIEGIGPGVAVGDLNGDGFDDVAFVFGQSTFGPPTEIDAWVIVSLSSSDTGDRNFTEPGFAGYRIADHEEKDLFGNALASGGDVDRDGFEDLLIGSVNINGGTGQADLVYGSTRTSADGDIDLATAPTSVALRITTSVANTSFSRSPAFVDLDASGRRDDLAFGAPAYDPPDLPGAGAVHLVPDLFPDTTPPIVEIGELGRTNDTTPSVTFLSPDPDVAGFACRVDDGAFEACTSPWDPATALAEDDHEVEVRATDTSGNQGSSTATVTIDTTGPVTTIDEAPTSPTTTTSVDVSFSSPDADVAEFRCAADDGAATACTSPHTFGPLAVGEHTLRVHALDDLGNVGAEATVDVEVIEGLAPNGGGVLDESLVEAGRISGQDRIETSIRLSRAAWTDATAAILARADDYADALASTTLAAAVDGPILQNPTAALDPRVLAEMQRLGVTTVYLAGGEVALSAAVATALEDAGLEVIRLAGDTRFDTAVLIADTFVSLVGPVDSLVVALGRDPQPGQAGWVDALASGTYAITSSSPMLLTTKDELPAVTAAAILDLLPDGGRVVLSGGPVAVSAAVEASIASLSGDLDVTRVSGDTRYDTAVALIDAAVVDGASLEIAFAASGRNYPDALSGAVAAWKVGGFLTLVDPTDLVNSTPTRDHLVEHADEIDTAVVVGGPVAVSDRVVTQVAAAIDGRIVR